jgi:hypothetical protein
MCPECSVTYVSERTFLIFFSTPSLCNAFLGMCVTNCVTTKGRLRSWLVVVRSCEDSFSHVNRLRPCGAGCAKTPPVARACPSGELSDKLMPPRIGAAAATPRNGPAIRRIKRGYPGMMPGPPPDSLSRRQNAALKMMTRGQLLSRLRYGMTSATLSGSPKSSSKSSRTSTSSPNAKGMAL